MPSKASKKSISGKSGETRQTNVAPKADVATETFTGRTPLDYLAPFITPDVMSEVADILNLSDPHKVALMVARFINPDHAFKQPEEARLRNIDPKTLRTRKRQGVLNPMN